MSWTCPFVLDFGSTAIPQGHWVTWLLWVLCPVQVPESESWAIRSHQKWKLLHQMQIFCAAVSLYHSWMHRCSSTSLHWHLFYAFLYVLMLFIPSICTVYPLSCHMVSMSWNDHSLLMQCPGRVQAVSMPCPGHVQQAVHLKLFWTCSRRTFATKPKNQTIGWAQDPVYTYFKVKYSNKIRISN